MTLDEAITDLSIQREVKRRLGKSYQADTLGLGIEALDAIKLFRSGSDTRHFWNLPGETPEGS